MMPPLIRNIIFVVTGAVITAGVIAMTSRDTIQASDCDAWMKVQKSMICENQDFFCRDSQLQS